MPVTKVYARGKQRKGSCKFVPIQSQILVSNPEHDLTKNSQTARNHKCVEQSTSTCTAEGRKCIPSRATLKRTRKRRNVRRYRLTRDYPTKKNTRDLARETRGPSRRYSRLQRCLAARIERKQKRDEPRDNEESPRDVYRHRSGEVGVQGNDRCLGGKQGVVGNVWTTCVHMYAP